MMLRLVRRVLTAPAKLITLPEVKSTRLELTAQKDRQQVERARTDRLAVMLDDYRRQDRLLRR